MDRKIKLKIIYYIVAALFLAYVSVEKIVNYQESENKGMQILEIISFGILAIFHLGEAIRKYKNAKAEITEY